MARRYRCGSCGIATGWERLRRFNPFTSNAPMDLTALRVKLLRRGEAGLSVPGFLCAVVVVWFLLWGLFWSLERIR